MVGLSLQDGTDSRDQTDLLLGLDLQRDLAPHSGLQRPRPTGPRRLGPRDPQGCVASPGPEPPRAQVSTVLRDRAYGLLAQHGVVLDALTGAELANDTGAAPSEVSVWGGLTILGDQAVFQPVLAGA